MVVTLGIAALWGSAEATLFFIVPDVCLTWVALSDLPLALRASVAAVTGAVAGGVVMYAWGRRQPERAAAVVAMVPGISRGLIVQVEHDLRTRGWFPMFVGSITAVPYKIYAIKSGTLGRSVPAFVVMSACARAIRFVALASVTSAISNALPDGPLVYRRMALLGVWAIVYVTYARTRGR